MLRKQFFPLSLLPVFSPLSAQQQSRCADCHVSALEPPAPYHFNAWERSAHGRNRVGCESCHCGNATTFESFRAHQDILDSRDPASPVYRRNIPQTCGACHTGQFVAFQDSGHYALLREGNQDTPICTTCHENVGARLLSPKGLAKQCSKCHDEGKITPRPEYPVQGKQLLEGIREVRALMDEARPLIRRVKDETRRESLQYAYDQAEVPLIEAVLAPCPTGWGFDPRESVEIGKLAVKTGVWPLKEFLDGKVVHTKVSGKRLPVEEYLKRQGRFSHLFKPRRQGLLLEEIQTQVDKYWDEYRSNLVSGIGK